MQSYRQFDPERWAKERKDLPWSPLEQPSSFVSGWQVGRILSPVQEVGTEVFVLFQSQSLFDCSLHKGIVKSSTLTWPCRMSRGEVCRQGITTHVFLIQITQVCMVDPCVMSFSYCGGCFCPPPHPPSPDTYNPGVYDGSLHDEF